VTEPPPDQAESAHEFCPVHASIEILQSKWTMHIIRALLTHQELGFNDLQRAVGANPATLSDRLGYLEQMGVVRRTVHSLMPPRTSYQLTPAGVALQDVIAAIGAWGVSHLDQQTVDGGKSEPPTGRRRRSV
jgi:DNA-binding HxlR family transcriptional regulator